MQQTLRGVSVENILSQEVGSAMVQKNCGHAKYCDQQKYYEISESNAFGHAVQPAQFLPRSHPFSYSAAAAPDRTRLDTDGDFLAQPGCITTDLLREFQPQYFCCPIGLNRKDRS